MSVPADPAAVPEAPPRDPTIRETLAALLASSRGLWLVNLVNFSDGVTYFGVLALTTLFLERDAGFFDGGVHRGVALASPLGLLLARRWLLRPRRDVIGEARGPGVTGHGG